MYTQKRKLFIGLATIAAGILFFLLLLSIQNYNNVSDTSVAGEACLTPPSTGGTGRPCTNPNDYCTATAPGSWGVCQPKKLQGESCTSSGECNLNNCTAYSSGGSKLCCAGGQNMAYNGSCTTCTVDAPKCTLGQTKCINGKTMECVSYDFNNTSCKSCGGCTDFARVVSNSCSGTSDSTGGTGGGGNLGNVVINGTVLCRDNGDDQTYPMRNVQVGIVRSGTQVAVVRTNATGNFTYTNAAVEDKLNYNVKINGVPETYKGYMGPTATNCADGKTLRCGKANVCSGDRTRYQQCTLGINKAYGGFRFIYRGDCDGSPNVDSPTTDGAEGTGGTTEPEPEVDGGTKPPITDGGSDVVLPVEPDGGIGSTPGQEGVGTGTVGEDINTDAGLTTQKNILPVLLAASAFVTVVLFDLMMIFNVTMKDVQMFFSKLFRRG